jgi:hypothetical protein
MPKSPVLDDSFYDGDFEYAEPSPLQLKIPSSPRELIGLVNKIEVDDWNDEFVVTPLAIDTKKYSVKQSLSPRSNQSPLRTQKSSRVFFPPEKDTTDKASPTSEDLDWDAEFQVNEAADTTPFSAQLSNFRKLLHEDFEGDDRVDLKATTVPPAFKMVIVR